MQKGADMKMFELEKYGKTHKITVQVASYMEGNLAVLLNCWEDGEPEPWNTLTVNLDLVRPLHCAYIDTNNNGEEILEWIRRNNLAEPTGNSGRSGYCVYPEYRFHEEVLMELDPEGYSEYLAEWKMRYGA